MGGCVLQTPSHEKPRRCGRPARIGAAPTRIGAPSTRIDRSMSRRQPQVAVIGAGSWGTAVASIVARHSPTVMWARSAEVAEQVNEKHTNDRYLPDFPLPPSLTATSDLQQAVEPS